MDEAKRFKVGQLVVVNSEQDGDVFRDEIGKVISCNIFGVTIEFFKERCDYEEAKSCYYAFSLDKAESLDINGNFLELYKKSDIAVHCPKEEQALEFCKWVDGKGLIQRIDVPYLKYKSKTCYASMGNLYHASSCKRLGYTVIGYSDLFDDVIKKTKKGINMKINDKEFIEKFAKGNNAINCRSIFEMNELFCWMEKNGFDWFDGWHEEDAIGAWRCNCENKAYRVNGYSDVDYYKSIGVDVIKYHDLIKNDVNMKNCDDVFKIGDRVVVNGKQTVIDFKNTIGTIITDEDSQSPGIEFDKQYNNMHDCEFKGTPGFCYWVDRELISHHTPPNSNKKLTSYKFRGDIDTDLLISDAIHDGTIAFVVVGDNEVMLYSHTSCEDFIKSIKFSRGTVRMDAHGGFFIRCYNLDQTKACIDAVKGIVTAHDRYTEQKKHELRGRNNINKGRTGDTHKVITFK